jgi:hypothetical protein
LEKLFRHPLSHNVEWREVLSLLSAIGTLEERRDGKFVLKLRSEPEIVERPKGKDLDADEVVELRRILRDAGYEPPND